jgi:hypothetical protein
MRLGGGWEPDNRRRIQPRCVLQTLVFTTDTTPATVVAARGWSAAHWVQGLPMLLAGAREAYAGSLHLWSA